MPVRIFFEDSKKLAWVPVCRGCLVQEDCLQFGIRTVSDGVFGGSTPSDRRRLNK